MESNHRMQEDVSHILRRLDLSEIGSNNQMHEEPLQIQPQ
jgi:hypothetical protein